ncbi:MAG: hypothetical protein Q4C95_11235 [Planctomycetia bacterium]|nr:hypothetical protein [Planctomycetia bacterium]
MNNSTDDDNQKCEAYKNAILYNQKEKAEELRTILSTTLTNPDAFFDEAEKWRLQCDELIQRGLKLAQSGKKRDSMEFEQLAKEAKKLGGTVKSNFCQHFDKAVNELIQQHADQCPPLNAAFTSSSSSLKKFFPDKYKTELEEIQKFAYWGEKY